MTVLIGLIIGLMQVGALIALGSILMVYFSSTKDPKSDRQIYWAAGIVMVVVELFTALILGWF